MTLKASGIHSHKPASHRTIGANKGRKTTIIFAARLAMSHRYRMTMALVYIVLPRIMILQIPKQIQMDQKGPMPLSNSNDSCRRTIIRMISQPNKNRPQTLASAKRKIRRTSMLTYEERSNNAMIVIRIFLKRVAIVMISNKGTEMLKLSISILRMKR